MSRWAVAAVVCLLAVSVPGCSGPPPAAQQGPTTPVGLANLTVDVRDDELLPLAGARVTLEPSERNVTTGAMGGVLIQGLLPGTYRATASRDGYVPRSENVTVAASDVRVRIILPQVPAPEPGFDLGESGGYCQVVDGDQEPPACWNALVLFNTSTSNPEATVMINASGLRDLWVAFLWEPTSDATAKFRFHVDVRVQAVDWQVEDAVEGQSGVTWSFDGDLLPPVGANDTLRVTFTPFAVDAPPGPTWADQSYKTQWLARFLADGG
jgi:hypothetical protein